MASGEEWVLQPALAGICKYESLVDGTLTLEDVARMNDALDVKAENEERLRRAERENA